MFFSRPGVGVLEVYEWSLGRDGFSVEEVAKGLGFDSLDETEEIVAELVDLRLVERSRDRNDVRYVPVDPGPASSRLLTRSELDLLEGKTAMGRLQSDLARISVLFQSSKFGSRSSNSFDIVKSRESAALLLSEAAANSSREVLCMKPGSAWSTEGFGEGQDPGLTTLDPGVYLRVLYQHTVRFDSTFRGHAAKLTESGAEVRTAGALIGSLFIFDRSTAYVLLDDEEGGAVVVHESSLVNFFFSCFEHVWATAKEVDNRRPEAEVVGRDMKQEIVRMLISGVKDEAIARRLGVSVRTCRKHIGEVMRMFGATSRFQFGYLVKEANLDEDL
ncbi:helix-turn-helix transcriptional regulator [Streptomyces sp. VB1]|uniref:helix-turn-helix transcriptional regulator n=1 Tax=Streptomyces sp. VB1 TaxID=2986803 RepID=UPI0022422327|nr:helix-turn-helix transcriptional regulator [Streptomyces sp. VB1]UZI31648.1 helix-turn-helix transcriptional regulator [Streptomyces sp. VB1]